MPSHARHIACLVIAALAATACSKSTTATFAETTDSAGVHIVHLVSSSATAPTWATHLIFSTATIDSLGFRDQRMAARFADDGSLLVADGDGIVLLDSTGRWIRRIARSGDGPGEYRQIASIGRADSGVAFAVEGGSLRTTAFTADGKVVRITQHLDPFRNARELDVVARLPDGRLVAIPLQWRPRAAPEARAITIGPIRRDLMALAVYNDSGRVVDSIGQWLGLERSEKKLMTPFARSTVYGNRGSVTAVSVTDSLDLSVYDQLTLRLRIIAPPSGTRPTAADYTAWKAAVKGSEELGDAADQIFEAEASVPRPPTLPSLGGIAADDHGNIWIGDYDGPGTPATRRWHIYSKAGAVVGQVVLPTYRIFTTFPMQTEILDIARGRIALAHEDPDHGLVIEVRAISTTP